MVSSNFYKKTKEIFQFKRDIVKYADKIVFIAGLPKSGTTWLQNMLSAIPGFSIKRPSHITLQDHSLKENTFIKVKQAHVVMRLHTQGTPENISILHKNGVKYCIMYRDMRDVAVSWFFFVKNVRREHQDHDLLQTMEINE